jgi:hypothetical protein
LLTCQNAHATLLIVQNNKKTKNKKMKKIKSFILALSATTLIATIVLQALPLHKASAAQITARKLTLQAGVTDGGSMPGGTVNHLFNATLPSATAIGSIKFQYCTTAAPVTSGIGCVSPTGINATGVTLGAETIVTGFTGISNVNEDDTTSGTINTVIISRAAAATITAGSSPSYRLDGIVNPSTPQTFFVRISTYTSLNGTGSPIDTGTVAAATSRQILISGTMPESLVFCAGATVGLTSGVPDCSTVTTGAIAFDRLFSPTDTALTSSQMAASTNAGFGYAITVNGPTLTSGSNTIAPLNTTDTSKYGVSQFGLNLVVNATPAIGTAIAPASNAANYRARPQTGYGTADSFTYNTGGTVADSGDGGTLGGTDAQIYTASYIVNVPGSQPAGTYTSTLTYICTATF